jgi:hypothetical protein
MNVAWLSDFFSGDNKIDITAVMTGKFGPDYQQMLTPFVEASSEGHWPILLPFNDGLLRFYAGAQDERTLREIRRVLTACLGSAYTEKELPIIRKGTNSSEKVLLQQVPSGVIRVTLLESLYNDLEAKKWIFKTLEKILKLYAQRPVLVVDVKRPVGRILREFFTAYEVSDGKGAEELFQEIKASGKLSQRNLLFLEYQALATSHQWEAILEHRQLTSCLKGRIPLHVRRLLLKSLANRLQNLLTEGFSGSDSKHVRKQCQVLVSLFATPPPFAELQDVTDEWKAWAIGASLYGFTDIGQCLPAEIESSWVSDLFVWTNINKGQDRGGAPQDGLQQEERGQYDLQRAKELLKATFEESGEELREIIIALSTLPGEVVRQIEKIPNLHRYWLTLQKQFISQDYGWRQWFADICEHDAQVDELRQLAMRECQDWPVSSFDADAILCTLETDWSGEAGEALRDVMPLMLNWLHSRGITCADLFWVKLLELLALDNIANQQDVKLASSLLEGMLSKSYSVDNYKNALQAVEILLEKVSSTKSYDAVLELMDLLLDTPCPSSEALQSLWKTIQSFAIIKWHRLSPLLRQLTLFSAREVIGVGAEGVFPEVLVQGSGEAELQERFPDLTGKVLAIYTLTEGAARRAKDMLESLFHGLLIHLNHDHVATSTLENLAKKADYFIFSTNSAKHEAFYAVTKIRPNIIYPDGKGASSIVRVFVATVNESML